MRDTAHAVIQGTVKRFLLANPKLETARHIGFVAVECDLRWSARQHVEDLAVWQGTDVREGLEMDNPSSILVTWHICELRFTVTPPL
jgi:hypothetical protein